MATTTRGAVPLASLGAPSADIEQAVNPGLQRLADVSALDDQGPVADRLAPGAALKGAYYWATDARFLARCDGTNWIPVVEFPIGGVLDWPGAQGSSPQGPGTWIEYANQTITRTTYPELFGAWGITGNTLILDRRGRVQIGAGSATGSTSERVVGQAGGEEKHQLTVAELPSHSFGSADSSGGLVATSANVQPYALVEGPGGPGKQGARTVTTNSVGGDQPHNVMQPFTVTRYFVRAR